MKKLLFRVFAVLLAANMLFLSLPTTAYAASNVTTINNFSASTNLNYNQYNALRTGSYSAVKRSGAWYYKFVKGSTIVYVKASAFSNSVGNNFSQMTTTLSNGVNRTDGAGSTFNYVYKKRTSTSTSSVAAASTKANKLGYTKRTTYGTYLTYLNVYSQRAGNDVLLGCDKNGHVLFTYSNKVNVNRYTRGYKTGGYITPSTAQDYKAALTRSTYNSVNVSFTPEFKVKVTQPGTNKVILSNFTFAGKGLAITKAKIDKYVNIGYTTVKTLGAAYSGKLTAKNLYDLYKQASSLVNPKSSEYESRKTILLSKGDKKCIEATFDSPIKLKNSGDYFQTEIKLSAVPSTSGTKTKITVSFSI